VVRTTHSWLVVRFRARSFGALAVFSAVIALIVALLALAVVQPTDPDCFEFCSVGQTLATGAISLVSLLWLTVVLGVALRLHRREPGVAILGAFAAALFLALLSSLDTYLWSVPSSYDSPVFVFDQLVLVLAVGVQLPAIWRLAESSRPASVGQLAVVISGLAVVAMAFALVVLGTTPFDSGPQVQFVAYLGFSAAVAVLAATSWGPAGSERPGLALVGGGALFYALVGAYDYALPQDSTALLLVAGPIIAIGWLLIGLAWLRSPVPLGANPDANVGATS
jgi:hypothetical protein